MGRVVNEVVVDVGRGKGDVVMLMANSSPHTHTYTNLTSDRVVGPALPTSHLAGHGLRRQLLVLPRHRRHRGTCSASIQCVSVHLSTSRTHSFMPSIQPQQMDGGRPLNKDHELATVGASNAIAGALGGFTGSYIFSQACLYIDREIQQTTPFLVPPNSTPT